MPELPEVQTVVSQLGRKAKGETITGFETVWTKSVKLPVAELKRAVIGAKIVGTRRFGKHIVIDLDNGRSLVIHLKMTGHLLVKDSANERHPLFRDRVNGYIRHVFSLKHGKRIEFSDMRKFGWIRLLETKHVESLDSIASLGVDALSPEFTFDRWNGILLKRKSRLIGTLLLDQALIAGIGNIYRSEALFRAGIRPMKKTARLSLDEKRLLHASIREVLREAVRLRGTSDGDFRDTAGRPGRFQKTLFVYRRAGEPCRRCGTIIRRIKLGQRSAFYCPQCQR